MESHAGDKVTASGETISDIQNYLASFNKEIQDGNASGHETGTAVVAVSSSENGTTTATEVSAVTTTEAYFTSTSGSTMVSSGFQTVYEGGTQHFNGGDNTFYQTAQYYAATDQSDHPPQFATVQQFEAPTVSGVAEAVGKVTLTNSTLLPAGVTFISESGHTPVTVSLVNDEHKQLVLAASSGDAHEANDSEATEISVTIPAALAGQAGTEELLQAVEEHASDSEPATFVAMPSNSGKTIHMVVQQQPGGGAGAGGGSSEHVQQDVEVASDAERVGGGGRGAVEMMANLTDQSAEATGGSEGDEQQHVLLNSNNQTYQTVTIVPSESNPGEVSYVLIVQQPDDDKGEKDSEVDVDMSIYDFNEGEQQGAHDDGDDDGRGGGGATANGDGIEGGGHGGGGHGGGRERGGRPTPKSQRVTKVAPKKSQSVTQAHMCNYCNYTSPKRYLLSRHMKSHSEERPHKCSVCERGFKTLASLQNHVNTHTGTRPHQCKECDSAFTTSGELVRHVRYRHTHEKPHRCTECDYASVELSKLKRHMRCHTGERPYQCPHCTYASPDTYKLKRHLRIHTGEKPYECDICRARFTQSNSLKAHKLIHTGNKPIFQCELCPTTCGRKTDLRIHVQKLHTSEKPLKCRRCGKSFPDRYTYKVHAKSHEGEKCFKCDLCPYASTSQRHLESHMLIHTDQKPFQCDQCEQSFRQKQLLKRHKNLYHNPDYVPPTPKEKTHECSECGRAFRHKGNLIRHMAIHDPDATAQEKEAAMLVHRRLKKKRINEAGIEEEYSEEEEADEFDDEDEYDDYDDGDTEISVGRQITTADGQQVVVLEVIQLQGPEGEQQAVAVLASDGMDMMDASGVVDNGGIMTSNDLASTLVGAEAIEHVGDILDGSATTATIVVEAASRKVRRSLRLKTEPADNDVDGEDACQDDGTASSIARATKGRRKRDDDEDFVYMPQAKRGRGRGSFASANRNRRQRTNAATEDEMATNAALLHLAEEMETNLPSEEELARREAEAEKRRQAQKQKDLEECFGFKDDDDDDDDDDETVDTSATESAIQLLAAMQNDD